MTVEEFNISTPALDVARRLVAVGCNSEHEAEWVTVGPMRLQQLLYYSQGWCLALFGRPLFPEQIEAWKQGPVVPEVHEALFAVKAQPITPMVIGEPEHTMPETIRSLLEMVWSRYSGITPKLLSEMTHREQAWCEAQRPDADGRRRNTLNLETMKRCFETECAKASKYDVAGGWRDELADELRRQPSLQADVAERLFALAD